MRLACITFVKLIPFVLPRVSALQIAGTCHSAPVAMHGQLLPVRWGIAGRGGLAFSRFGDAGIGAQNFIK
jgi:hypothetical protein